jgi:nitroreductase
MDIFNSIHSRQSIGKVKPDPVAREVLERLLDAAAQAPNHHKVRPWRFIVLTGAARDRLGVAMAQSLQQRKPDTPAEGLEAERAKALRAPVIIAVAVAQPEGPKVDLLENICAASAATQNLLLAATALGLGAIWRTGGSATDPHIKAFLGLAPDQPLIAFVYLGYPTHDPLPPQRPGADDRTVWLD